MRARLSLHAQLDLRRIASRIALENAQAARGLILKLRDRVRLAGRSPKLGRKVPELDRDDLREAIVGNYRVVYLVRPKLVEILRVFEGHLPLPELE